MNKEFSFDVNYFKKKLLQKIIFQVFLYILILAWSFLQVEESKKTIFLIFCLGFFSLLFVFLKISFGKQISIFQKMKIGINQNLLQVFSSNGECTNLNLKRVLKIEKDKLGSFTRYSFFETLEEFVPVLNLLNPEEFEKIVEEISGKKIDFYELSLKNWLLKGSLFFIPAILSFILYFLKSIEIGYFYLVLLVNSFFFFIQFSEKRMRAGFNAGLVRRVCFILSLVIFYQIFWIYSN